MIKNVLKVSALVLFLGLASGCATTGADENGGSAAAALSAAEAARAVADRAAQAAAAAQRTADQALKAATGAQNCCEANRESMDRMFKKTMSK